ncbi:MAG: ABC transporter substrate-binding protein [Actinomycetota bacterium]
MTSRHLLRLLAMLLAFGLVAAACGSDDEDDAGDDASASASETADEAEGDEEAAPDDSVPADEGEGDDEEAAAAGGVLSGVCPATIVIQTDWFPESEHGAMYNLIGDDYVIDIATQTVTGSLVSGGEDTGVDVEVRTGGPAIGFTAPPAQLYADDAIHFGYVSTDEGFLLREDTPTIAVMAPLEKNPQMIMWDPETYPDVESIADLGEAGITINVFAGQTYAEVFVAQGILSEDQLDPSYDGGPARFIAEGGAIAQQGFASAEPYNYENVFEDWGKPVQIGLLNDAGFEIYSQALAIKEADLEELRPCLEVFVPIVQQATVDFYNDPARANGIIIDAVTQYDSFWVYDEGIAEFSVSTQLDLGLAGNGPDATVGNMDPDRIQRVLDSLVEAGLLDEGTYTPDDIMTNEFIDESIGF